MLAINKHGLSDQKKSKKSRKKRDREREMMMRALLLLCLGVVVNSSNPQMPLSASFLGGDLEAERNSRKSHAVRIFRSAFTLTQIFNNIKSIFNLYVDI